MRVLIADDHPVFLVGIRHVLELDGGFEIVAEAHHGPEVLPLVGQTQPEVVLLDMRMPGLDGLTCLDRLRARYPEVHVVMCSMCADLEQIQSALTRGACGYIVKSVDQRDLCSAIRQAVDGTADHAVGLPEDTILHDSGLTSREVGVMKAVERGLTNRALAKELWISEQTVKFHLTNIYTKLGVSNRTELALWALTHGLESHPYENVS